MVDSRYHAKPRLPSTRMMPDAINTLFISRFLLLVWRAARRAHHSNSPSGLSGVVAHRIGTPDTPLVLHPRYHHNIEGLFLGRGNHTYSSVFSPTNSRINFAKPTSRTVTNPRTGVPVGALLLSRDTLKTCLAKLT